MLPVSLTEKPKLLPCPENDSVHPFPITSRATARLLEICLDQELRLGLEIERLDSLRQQDRATFIGRLTVALSAKQAQVFNQAMVSLTAHNQEIFLRRLSGEENLTAPDEKEHDV